MGSAAENLNRIRQQVALGSLRVTAHAQSEMAEEEILLDSVLEAMASGEVLEDYPLHRRGLVVYLAGALARVGRCTLYAPQAIHWRLSLRSTNQSRRSGRLQMREDPKHELFLGRMPGSICREACDPHGSPPGEGRRHRSRTGRCMPGVWGLAVQTRNGSRNRATPRPSAPTGCVGSAIRIRLRETGR